MNLVFLVEWVGALMGMLAGSSQGGECQPSARRPDSSARTTSMISSMVLVGPSTQAARLERSRVSSRVAANDDGTATTATASAPSSNGSADSPTVITIKRQDRDRHARHVRRHPQRHDELGPGLAARIGRVEGVDLAVALHVLDERALDSLVEQVEHDRVTDLDAGVVGTDADVVAAGAAWIEVDEGHRRDRPSPVGQRVAYRAAPGEHRPPLFRHLDQTWSVRVEADRRQRLPTPSVLGRCRQHRHRVAAPHQGGDPFHERAQVDSISAVVRSAGTSGSRQSSPSASNKVSTLLNGSYGSPNASASTTCAGPASSAQRRSVASSTAVSASPVR